jgi:L-asparagine oxygenase
MTATPTNRTLTRHLGDSPGLELTDAEGAALRALAQGLARTAPSRVDDAGWLAQARLACCRLPARVMEVTRRFRHDPGIDGTLTIANLPLDADALPPTPCVPGSVERAATVPATIAMLLAQQIGEVVAYRAEKEGALVQNVVPVPALARSQSNGGSVPLEFHTENAFHPHRPDYLGLLCLRAARQEAASTHVASVRRVLPLLAEGDRKILHEPRFTTAAPPSFRSAGYSGPHPVLTGSPEDPDIRVDFHATSAMDGEAAATLTRLRAALTEVRTDLVLHPGDVVFLDNRLVVHGRGAFVPQYDGSDRWLHRVFVHLDNRRTRAYRADGSGVLA